MIYDCTNDNKDKNYLNYFDVNFPGNEFKYINKTLTTSGGLNGPKFSYEISDIPLGPMTGKFEFSNENIRAGAGVGIGNWICRGIC